MKTADTDTVIDLLRQVAAERPDYVYAKPSNTDGPRCLYVHGDKPGCIVGTIFDRLGVPLHVMKDHEGARVSSLIQRLRSRGDLDVSYEGAQILGRVQRDQDNGRPWGEAVEAALLEHKRHLEHQARLTARTS